jgi:hypothetical protein
LSVVTLPQYIEGDERTPMEVVRAARPEISDLQEELGECEEQLGSATATGAVQHFSPLPLGAG